MKKCFVYLIQSGNKKNSPVKIGMANNPHDRIKQLQTGNPVLLRLRLTVECSSREHAMKVEKLLHRELKNRNIINEWFSVSETNLLKTLNLIGNHEAASCVRDCDIVHNDTLGKRKREKRIKAQSKALREHEKALQRRTLEVKALKNMLYDAGYDCNNLKDDLRTRVLEKAARKGIDISCDT